MLLLGFLYFFSLACQPYTAPVQDAISLSLPVLEKAVQDSVQLLTDEWVLREQLHREGDTYTPVQPLDSLTLKLFDDNTYQLKRQIHVPKATEKVETVEWGKWQLSDDRSLISVQVTNIDGHSTLSAMLGRWRIRKLTPQQLILKPYGAGDQYLVFERVL